MVSCMNSYLIVRRKCPPSCQPNDLTRNTLLPTLHAIAAELNTISKQFVTRIAGMISNELHSDIGTVIIVSDVSPSKAR